MEIAHWKRSIDSSNYPIVYEEFVGTREVNGSKRKYWIQDLTEEYFEEVLYHYENGFVCDEILCKYTKIKEDPEALQEFCEMWKIILQQRVSVICLTKDSEGNNKIAGFNCLAVHQKTDPEIVMKNEKSQTIFAILDYLEKKRDVFKEFNTDKYITALGVYVLPDYRGENLAVHILNARNGVGKAIGIKLTMTLFTSFISQKQAVKAGFQDFVVEDYQTLGKIDKRMEIPNIHEHTKATRYMYKKL